MQSITQAQATIQTATAAAAVVIQLPACLQGRRTQELIRSHRPTV